MLNILPTYSVIGVHLVLVLITYLGQFPESNIIIESKLILRKKQKMVAKMTNGLACISGLKIFLQTGP